MAANLMNTNLATNLTMSGNLSANAIQIFGKKMGLWAKLFGCSHKGLSRPFSRGMVGYRTCLQCGARTEFDLETRTTSGTFYDPPPASSEDLF